LNFQLRTSNLPSWNRISDPRSTPRVARS